MRPRVLIVEDDAVTRTLLTALTEQQGCSVDIACDGEEAIEHLASNDYDAILLDIVLPKRSGTEVMDYLRERRPATLERVIVVTGLDVGEIRALFPTVCHALGKPVIPKRLIDSLTECLRPRPAPAALVP